MHRYHDHTPKHIQKFVNEVVVEAMTKRNDYINEEFLSSIVEWLPNLGHTQGRQNKYLCTLELYWNIKTLIVRSLNDKQDTNKNLYFQLRAIQVEK